MPQETTDLGPQPEPEIEPREPNPGGADAMPQPDEAIPADLSTVQNPAVDASDAPDELQETEDTSTEATDDEDGTSPSQGESTG